MEEIFFNDGVFQLRTDATMPKYVTIGLARCDLKDWLEYNPVLRKNELGFIKDTKEFVLGDGFNQFDKFKRYKFILAKGV